MDAEGEKSECRYFLNNFIPVSTLLAKLQLSCELGDRQDKRKSVSKFFSASGGPLCRLIGIQVFVRRLIAWPLMQMC